MRALAGGSISIVRHDEIHDDEVLVQLADGRARLDDTEAEWRKAGVYRVADGKLAEARLVPLSQSGFDQARSAARRTDFSFRQRIRPQDCATSQALGHSRMLEFCEAAFIEAWRQ